MPVLRVSMWKGRTRDQKVTLARELTAVFERVCNIQPASTTIIFEEVDKENWASSGLLESDK